MGNGGKKLLVSWYEHKESEKFLHPFVVMDLFCHKFALFKAKKEEKTFGAFFIIV
jgi:hypothetical protein